MQTPKSVKKNRYKYHEGEHVWILPEDNKGQKVLVKIKKLLLRPFREAPNFYLCEHCGGRRRFEKIHYEGEMEAVEEEPEYWSEPLI